MPTVEHLLDSMDNKRRGASQSITPRAHGAVTFFGPAGRGTGRSLLLALSRIVGRRLLGPAQYTVEHTTGRSADGGRIESSAAEGTAEKATDDRDHVQPEQGAKPHQPDGGDHEFPRASTGQIRMMLDHLIGGALDQGV